MKSGVWIPCLLLLLVASIIVSPTLGKYPLSLGEIFNFLSASCGFGSMDGQKFELFKNIIVDIRLPRILAAVLIGAAPSVYGASFQSMFINPLVSPALHGVLLRRGKSRTRTGESIPYPITRGRCTALHRPIRTCFMPSIRQCLPG